MFSALVVRLLRNDRYNPKNQLEDILRPANGPVDGFMFGSLDQLYLDVLKKATKAEDGSVDEGLVSRVKKVIGALVLLQQPLTPSALSVLLEDERDYVARDIQYLSAVLSLPDDVTQPPTIFHPSFADFALLRCTDSKFKIDAPEFHGYLALRCLLLMNERYLRRDICGIRNSS